MENPIKMDDLGVPLFSETSIYLYIHINAARMMERKRFFFSWLTWYLMYLSPVPKKGKAPTRCEKKLTSCSSTSCNYPPGL